MKKKEISYDQIIEAEKNINGIYDKYAVHRQIKIDDEVDLFHGELTGEKNSTLSKE